MGLATDGRRQHGGMLLAVGGLLAAIVLAGAWAATEASAAKKAGRLDRNFSRDGKVVTAFPPERPTRDYVDYRLPFEFAAGRITMAPAGRGGIVVANNKAIVQFLANGRRNPRFGGSGAVPIGGIEGSRFQLADVAVDSQRRVLIAGTTRPNTRLGMAGLPEPGPIPAMATIRRYLPNGQLDAGFGNEGVLNTDFGVAPPTFAGQFYPGSAVAVVGLAVDGADRPVLTGSAVVEVGRCTPSQNRYETSQAIVARLSGSGALDTTFAGGGVKTVGGLSWLGSPTFTPAGLVATGTSVNSCARGGPPNPSVLVRLDEDGNVDGGFGSGGFWSRPFTRISGLAPAPSGKLVLLARTIELFRGRWIESPGTAVRLRANGSLDRGFGQGGRTEPKLPRDREILRAIEVDASGRVLLLGDAWRKRGKALKARLLLMRLTASGEPDRGFGRRGRVYTGFGATTKNVFGTELLTGPAGRVIAGGKIVGRAPNAFVLVRYLGR